jgi:hypothetical protein
MEEKVDFSKVQPEDKQYYFVPLKLQAGGYVLDTGLLDLVEQVATQGYRQARNNEFAWMKAQGFPDEEKQALLQDKILVREQKPHICYTFIMTMDKLHEMSAE